MTHQERREYYKNYYRTHPEYRKKRLLAAKKQRTEKKPNYIAWQKAFYLKRRLLLSKLKSKPCRDCKKKFPPYVMDFDHPNPSKKLFSIARGHRYNLDRLIAEIKKCHLVCSNCHRIRTFKRMKKHYAS